MSDMQNFIETPQESPGFVPRLLQSLRTSVAFIKDQRWASLIFLVVYLGLIYWDYHSVRLLPLPPPPDWTRNWPDFFDPIKIELARSGLTTWRSMLASLVTVLYWGNALLYIADRSAAFPEDNVVGLVRFLVRGVTIGFLLALPLALGLVLLMVPGIFVANILVTAATITMFREFGVFHAIAESYRLITRSIPGQPRMLGFSRSFFHITGAYVCVLVMTLMFTFLTLLLMAGFTAFMSNADLPLTYALSAISNLIGSFLNLSFSIFVLRLYAEYRTHGLGFKRETSPPPI